MSLTAMTPLEERLSRKAKETFANKEKILANVYFRLLPITSVGDKVSELFVGNLYKTYYLVIDISSKGIASSSITWSMLNAFGVSEEDLKAHAEENTIRLFGKYIEPIASVITEMMDADTPFELPLPEDGPKMLVITNESKTYGSALICCKEILKEIYDYFQDSFWILPSSTHEVIALKASDAISDDLRNMVKEVNDSVVDPKDILSYDVFFCSDPSTGIEIA